MWWWRLEAPDEELIPEFDDPEEEPAPMLLPVDLSCPGGDVWPTVPPAEGAGVAAFDGVVFRSFPVRPPEEAPDEFPGGV